VTEAASRIGKQFPAADKAGLQMPFLILLQVGMVDNENDCFEQEATGTAGWIADGIVGSRLDVIDDRFDEFARREVLPRVFGAFAAALFERTFADTPFRCRLARPRSGGPLTGFGNPAPRL
jgi:hypothetical protein